jgi:cell division protein FtsB
MMMRRRRGPSLLGVAAVAGTAAYVGNKSAQKGAQQQANEQAQNQQLAELEQQNAALAAQQQALLAQQAPAAAPVAAAPAAPAQSDMMVQLKQFADLHAAGVLTDEEFAAAKAKVLAGG